MNFNFDFCAIEQKIGYVFKDKTLLKRAFTHPTANHCVNENYETLEFLGDSILDFLAAKILIAAYPDANEGELTKRRIAIVNHKPLNDAIVKLDLAQYVVVGRGESVDKITVGDVKSDIYEALLAAMYIDSQSLDVVERFILRTLKEVPASDFKSELNSLMPPQKHVVEYRSQESGAAHERVFYTEVYIDGKRFGEGRGSSKISAEQAAAKQAVAAIYAAQKRE